jgi:hypothetical protein
MQHEGEGCEDEGSEGEGGEGEGGEGKGGEGGGVEDGKGEAGEDEIGGCNLVGVGTVEEKESSLLSEVLQPTILRIALFLTNSAALLLALMDSDSGFCMMLLWLDWKYDRCCIW